jgi:uncharacterized membrane protein
MADAIQIEKKITMDKALRILVWFVLAIPLVYLAFTWNELPATIALHFDLEGNPDQFGNKNKLLLMVILLSVFTGGIYLLLTNIYRIDPKRSAPENKTRLQRIGFVISVFVAGMLCFIIYSSMHANTKISTRLIFAGVGILFCFIGNYIHNIKPNYFAGLRLPWTLENETNWRKTHLLGGKLFFAGGMLMAILSLLLPVKLAVISFFSIACIITVIPIVYSYQLYRKQKRSTQ